MRSAQTRPKRPPALLTAGLVAATLTACSGGQPTPQPTATSSVLDGSWIAQIANQPDLFGGVVDVDSRAAWVAMHEGRWADAAQALPPGVGRARAELELAVFYEDLADLASVAWPDLAATWLARDSGVSDGPMPFLAAVAVISRDHHADTGLSAPTAGQQALLTALQTESGALPKGTALDGLDQAGCLAGDLARLSGQSEQSPQGCRGDLPLDLDAEGTWYDPLVYDALAHQTRRRADRSLGDVGWEQRATQAKPPLDLLLFGPAWTTADLSAAAAADSSMSTIGASGPTLSALHLPDEGPTDEPQAARERVRALDRELDPWQAHLLDTVSDDGKALLTDLQLVAQVRSRILLAWARLALHNDRPHQATAYLLLAIDIESARTLGPLNPPSLYALAAQASLRTGRTREALDYLSVLEAPYPIVTGLDETIGDLAVLEGLGRHGDSKEN